MQDTVPYDLDVATEFMRLKSGSSLLGDGKEDSGGTFKRMHGHVGDVGFSGTIPSNEQILPEPTLATSMLAPEAETRPEPSTFKVDMAAAEPSKPSPEAEAQPEPSILEVNVPIAEAVAETLPEPSKLAEAETRPEPSTLDIDVAAPIAQEPSKPSPEAEAHAELSTSEVEAEALLAWCPQAELSALEVDEAEALHEPSKLAPEAEAQAEPSTFEVDVPIAEAALKPSKLAPEAETGPEPSTLEVDMAAPIAPEPSKPSPAATPEPSEQQTGDIAVADTLVLPSDDDQGPLPSTPSPAAVQDEVTTSRTLRYEDSAISGRPKILDTLAAISPEEQTKLAKPLAAGEEDSQASGNEQVAKKASRGKTNKGNRGRGVRGRGRGARGGRSGRGRSLPKHTTPEASDGDVDEESSSSEARPAAHASKSKASTKAKPAAKVDTPDVSAVMSMARYVAQHLAQHPEDESKLEEMDLDELEAFMRNNPEAEKPTSSSKRKAPTPNQEPKGKARRASRVEPTESEDEASGELREATKPAKTAKAKASAKPKDKASAKAARKDKAPKASAKAAGKDKAPKASASRKRKAKETPTSESDGSSDMDTGSDGQASSEGQHAKASKTSDAAKKASSAKPAAAKPMGRPKKVDPNLSPAQLEAKAKASRKSSAYHVARNAALKKGYSAEQAKRLATEATHLQVRLDDKLFSRLVMEVHLI